MSAEVDKELTAFAAFAAARLNSVTAQLLAEYQLACDPLKEEAVPQEREVGDTAPAALSQLPPSAMAARTGSKGRAGGAIPKPPRGNSMPVFVESHDELLPKTAEDTSLRRQSEPVFTRRGSAISGPFDSHQSSETPGQFGSTPRPAPQSLSRHFSPAGASQALLEDGLPCLARVPTATSRVARQNPSGLNTRTGIPDWTRRELRILRQKETPHWLWRWLGLQSRAAETRAHRLRQRRGSIAFEAFFLFVLMVNALVIAWELDYESDLPDGLIYISFAFTLIFTLELFLRLLAVRSNIILFVFGKDGAWNVFDVIVVAALWTEQILRTFGNNARHAAVLQGIRLLKLTRVLRMVRSVEWLREFSLLLRAMWRSMGSLLWIMVFTCSAGYFTSVIVASQTLPLCRKQEFQDSHSEFCHYFGSLRDLQMSLVQAISGGILWGELSSMLNEVDIIYKIVFLTFVAFGLVVIFNLATGILLDVHASCKKSDLESIKKQAEHDRAVFVERVRELFYQMDASKSGAVSHAEVEMALEDPDMNALMRSLQVEIYDSQFLFELLGQGGSIPDCLDAEEFIVACLELRGPAKAVGLVRLQLQVEELKLLLMEVISANRAEAGRDNSMSSLAFVGGSTDPAGMQPAKSQAVSHVPTEFSEALSYMGSDSMMPTWGGVRIPKVEERAMLLAELRMLRNHIFAHHRAWRSQLTGSRLQLEKVSMYDVSYNWVCPLTVPDGVYLEGLNLTDLETIEEGCLVCQDPMNSAMVGKLAMGKFVKPRLSPIDSGYRTSPSTVHVMLSRGQFVSVDAFHSEALLEGTGEIYIGDKAVGRPTSVSRPTSLSYKEFIATEPQIPAWYCCHWWGESIMDFISCVEEHHRTRGEQALMSAYWVCAFANSQHDLGIEISDDPEKSSFRRAMQQAQGVLLLLDPEATSFSRIWCCYELYKTMLDDAMNLDIVAMNAIGGASRSPQVLADLPGESAILKTRRESNFPINVLAKGICTRLEEGEATVQQDKDRILFYMRQHADNSDEAVQTANRTLNAFFAWAAFPQAVKRGLVRNFILSNPNSPLNRSHKVLALPEVTRQDAGRKRLQLSFANFQDVTDSTMNDIVRGLPPNLTEFALDCTGCVNVTDLGLTRLAQGVSELVGGPLVSLRLEFLSCKHISDLGIRNLATSLPKSLRCLSLDFAKCPHVSKLSAIALSENMPQDIQEFSAIFKGTSIDKNFNSIEELRRMMRSQGAHGFTDWVRVVGMDNILPM